MDGRHPFGDYQQPVQSAQLFDAFGERIYDEESTALSDPIGYKGQWGCYTDPELPLQYQLVYCHNRYYSPYLGRWISRDPAGANGGLNAYEFCGNNPIVNSDPSGLFFYRATGESLPLCGGGLSFADQATDFAAGWGDNLSIGATKWARRGIGALFGIGDATDVIDYDSGAYSAGQFAGAVNGFLMGDGGGGAGAIEEGGRVLGTLPNEAATAEEGASQVGRELFRVVEGPEETALAESGGVPTMSPMQDPSIGKPFWSDQADAEAYQRLGTESNFFRGPTRIWRWENPAGVGEPTTTFQAAGPCQATSCR